MDTYIVVGLSEETLFALRAVGSILIAYVSFMLLTSLIFKSKNK